MSLINDLHPIQWQIAFHSFHITMELCIEPILYEYLRSYILLMLLNIFIIKH